MFSLFLQNNQLNPVWNEHFEFVIEDATTQHLTVKIYDDEGLQSAELIGCVQVHLSELQPGKVKDVWLKLVKDLDIQRDNKNRGQVIFLTTNVFSILVFSTRILSIHRFGRLSCWNKLHS